LISWFVAVLNVQMLINAGCPVNLVKHRGRGEVPEYGIQPLHLSTYGGGYPEVARALLEAGAAVDAAESNGRTTLHHAAIRNAFRVVDVLLEYQCDLDPIRFFGNFFAPCVRFAENVFSKFCFPLLTVTVIFPHFKSKVLFSTSPYL